jgi:dTDP-4-amino-4,6-dideoxygalactose transaminase
MLTTDDPAIADQLRLLRSHGERGRYRHEVLGYNYRLTDIQAALGLVQLDRLEWLTRQRIRHAETLTSHLSGVTTPTIVPGYRHVFHQYTIRVPQGRDVIARRLQEVGVSTAVHYPIPIHRQPLYRSLGYRTRLPIAEQASNEVLSLPVHPALTRADLTLVAERVSSTVARLAPRAATQADKNLAEAGDEGYRALG